MRSRILAGLLMVGMAGVAAAQPGMRGMRGMRGAGARAGMGGPAAAEMLLANTGRLQLTDQQVSRLAAIARRSEARRQALRASMDSARTRFGGGAAVDTAARRQFAERMRTEMTRAREQSQTDRRDAIAVLTPDQQARAWEMIAARGRAARGARGQGMRQGRQMRPMRPMPPMRGMRPKRRPDR